MIEFEDLKNKTLDEGVAVLTDLEDKLKRIKSKFIAERFVEEWSAKNDFDRSLVFFDFETTGLDPYKDQIVSYYFKEITPSGKKIIKEGLLKPYIPIKKAAAKIHGITSDRVKDKPHFKQIAKGLLEYLSLDKILLGYNIFRFDLPILRGEFERIGIKFNPMDFEFIDVFKLITHYRGHSLKVRAEEYCGEIDQSKLHDAGFDVLLTEMVFRVMLIKHGEELNLNKAIEITKTPPAGCADLHGRLKWEDDDLVFNFGKYMSTPLPIVFEQNGSYFDWLLDADFPDDFKEIIRNAKKGEYPEKREID
jgi:DNA polymerase-3 subunit epsilon